MNAILQSDAYKLSHWLQYPPATTSVFSYLESRGGLFPQTVFFGLQAILKKHFEHDLHEGLVRGADKFAKDLFGTDRLFNHRGWSRLVYEHGGNLPLRIRAVPEGSVVPTGNALMTVENTYDDFPWLVGWAETVLLQAWYPITVATLSWEIAKLIDLYAMLTGTTTSPFHLNDFGFRGCSSVETAAIGGAAHLVNFSGTDTLPGIHLAKRYYSAQGGVGMSVMASEHSTTTIWNDSDSLDNGEEAAWRHMLNAAPPESIVSLVVDSYDTMYAVDAIIGNLLKDVILARPGKVVVRPDSGNPVKLSVAILESLWRNFGGTVNAKGFRVLDPHVGVIWGDGININSIEEILSAVVDAGFCVSNIVFGMGGALLQQVHRDTQRFAFKCSAAKVGGAWRDVYKAPKTDSGKVSKRGRLKLVLGDEGYQTVTQDQPGDDQLVTVWENGRFVKQYDFDEIRARALAARQA